MNSSITTYIEELNKVYQTQQATEATYRGILQNLIKALLPKVTIIHEPKRSAYGVPDYKLLKNDIAVSFIETKNIKDKDLKGEKEKLHREQFDRYKSALNTIVFTDYLTFHLYENGELTNSAIIGNVASSNIIRTEDEKEELAFLKIIQVLGNAAPQKITQAGKLAEIMAAKAKLIASIISNAMAENATDEDQNLHNKLNAFQKILVHDMDEKQFADFYAQTIVYGMFIARINDKTPKNFSRLEAGELIPSFNPFLKKIFKNIALAELHSCIAWIVDDLAEIFKVTDMKRVLRNYGNSTGRKDPVIHFYEEFLEKYNPKIREEFGVWYTPNQVVKFIVNAVNGILINELNIANGLANNTKIKVVQNNSDEEKEYHRVQILDPATGTGTFLAEVCNAIHDTYKGQEGLWPGDVINHLVPRINGFEYLMAPYTMAHLKLATALQLDQNKGTMPERLNIYLTNSLEEEQPETHIDFGTFVSDEANAANTLKRETPVMVVMGNPPYNERSANKGEWIMNLMDDYKQEPGESKVLINKKNAKKLRFKNTLKERNPKGINNDYCKFIRLGQHFVNRTQEGVLAYITANTYLDTRLFRGMRYNLLDSFDKVYILNLHGSTMRNESTAELKDQCIFDIMQGVAISIFIKTKREVEYDEDGKRKPKPLAKVYYKDLYGSRKQKLDYLEEHSLEQIDFEEIEPSKPLYIFRQSNKHLQEEYERGFKIDQLMKGCVQGFKTGKDEISIQYSKERMMAICEKMAESKMPIENILSTYGFPERFAKRIEEVRKSLCSANYNWKNNLRQIQYRPFDKRWTVYGRIFMDRYRPEIEKNVIGKNNIILGIGKSGNVMGDAEWSLTFISDLAMDINVIPRGGIYLFPLYLYEGMLCTPNFSYEILGKIESNIGLSLQEENYTERQEGRFLPIDVIDYVYAVLHSPLYRDTYKDFLQSDFPTIPYPSTKEYFFAMAEKGKELRELHLMKQIELEDLITQYPVSDTEKENIVEVHRFEEKDEEAMGRVYINKTQYFDNVPTDVWNQVIAGYQMADKWLKDRLNQHLTNEEIIHYQKMIVAIKRTIEVQEEIDDLIRL